MAPADPPMTTKSRRFRELTGDSAMMGEAANTAPFANEKTIKMEYRPPPAPLHDPCRSSPVPWAAGPAHQISFLLRSPNRAWSAWGARRAAGHTSILRLLCLHRQAPTDRASDTVVLPDRTQSHFRLAVRTRRNRRRRPLPRTTQPRVQFPLPLSIQLPALLEPRHHHHRQTILRWR